MDKLHCMILATLGFTAAKSNAPGCSYQKTISSNCISLLKATTIAISSLLPHDRYSQGFTYDWSENNCGKIGATTTACRKIWSPSIAIPASQRPAYNTWVIASVISAIANYYFKIIWKALYHVIGSLLIAACKRASFNHPISQGFILGIVVAYIILARANLLSR